MMEHPRLLAFALLVVAILFSTTGELFFKKGMDAIGGLEFSPAGLLRAFLAWQVLLGFALFFTGAVVWLRVLSLADLSWAYPMLALGYPLVVLESRVLLGEPVDAQRILGSLVILAGVAIMYASWKGQAPAPVPAPTAAAVATASPPSQAAPTAPTAPAPGAADSDGP